MVFTAHSNYNMNNFGLDLLNIMHTNAIAVSEQFAIILYIYIFVCY